jgi:hypothetical protein
MSQREPAFTAPAERRVLAQVVKANVLLIRSLGLTVVISFCVLQEQK